MKEIVFLRTHRICSNEEMFLRRTDFIEDSIKEIGAGHFGCVYRLKLKTKTNETLGWVPLYAHNVLLNWTTDFIFVWRN